jgi:release factor glutamine methyltransferase
VTASPPMLDEATVVRRLRAAGCVFAEDEARLLVAAAECPDRLTALVDRRVSGVPLEYVLGWAEFGGLRVAVDLGVFVPRRRTEFLARQAIGRAAPDAVVVDLCCGSGAVGAAVAAALPDARVHAADVDPAAVACARRNLPGDRVHCGDLFDALPDALRGRVDVLVANVPYVPSEAIALMPPEAREHEPRRALDGGSDGLDIARRVVAAAGTWLAPRGSVLFEVSEAQVPAAMTAVRRAGLAGRLATDEDRSATVVAGTAQ